MPGSPRLSEVLCPQCRVSLSFTPPGSVSLRTGWPAVGWGFPFLILHHRSLTCLVDLSERRLQPVTDSRGLKLHVQHSQERGTVSSSFMSQTQAWEGFLA